MSNNLTDMWLDLRHWIKEIPPNALLTPAKVLEKMKEIEQENL